MKFRAFTTSWKTTLAAVAALLVAVGSAGEALLDDRPETVPDLQQLMIAALAVITALTAFFSRDADKSSQDAGIRK